MTIPKHPWRWIFLAGAILWMCFIFGMSASPGEESNEASGRLVAFVQQLFFPKWSSLPEEELLLYLGKLNFFIRKLAHFTEFAILGIWLSMFFMTLKKSFGFRFAGSLLIGTLYSAIDEIHQLFVKNRYCSIYDMLIDSAGCLLGILICHLIYERWKKAH